VTFIIHICTSGELVNVENPDPSLSLVEFLRSRGLTGTKVSCAEGSCGAYTVLLGRVGCVDYEEVEEVTVTACTTPITSLHGTHVTTVEGVGGTRDGLHPVQERLYKCHGSQCGFCSPGMVMSMVGVLRNCPTPDIEDITRGLQVKAYTRGVFTGSMYPYFVGELVSLYRISTNLGGLFHIFKK
jgi:xanthine dehydrogenase iron-sulfur cluster and FAD-binding subunit A